MLLGLDAELRRFVTKSTRQSCALPANLSATQRDCAVAIAATCGLDTEEIAAANGGVKLSISKTPRTRCPAWRLADAVSGGAPAHTPARLVQRRDVGGGSSGNATGGATGETGGGRRAQSQRSIEEREAEYARARERLLGADSGGADTSAQGEPGVSVSAAVSAAAGAAAAAALVPLSARQATNRQPALQPAADDVGASGGKSSGKGGSRGAEGANRDNSSGGGGRKAIFRDREAELQDPEFRRRTPPAAAYGYGYAGGGGQPGNFYPVHPAYVAPYDAYGYPPSGEVHHTPLQPGAYQTAFPSLGGGGGDFPTLSATTVPLPPPGTMPPPSQGATAPPPPQGAMPLGAVAGGHYGVAAPAPWQQMPQHVAPQPHPQFDAYAHGWAQAQPPPPGSG